MSDENQATMKALEKKVKRSDIINDMIKENRSLIKEEYDLKKEKSSKKIAENFDDMLAGKKEMYREAIEKIFRNLKIDHLKYKQNEKYYYPELFEELLKTFLSEKGSRGISKKKTGDKEEIEKQYGEINFSDFRKKFNLKKISQIEYREKILFFESVYERLLLHYKGTEYESKIQADFDELKIQYDKYKVFYIEIVSLQNKIENCLKRLIEKTVPEIMAINGLNIATMRRQIRSFAEDPTFEGVKNLAKIYDIDESLTVVRKELIDQKNQLSTIDIVSRMELFRADRLILLETLQEFLKDAIFDWNLHYRRTFLEERRTVIFKDYQERHPDFQICFGEPTEEMNTKNELNKTDENGENTLDPFEIDALKFMSPQKLELLAKYDYQQAKLGYVDFVSEDNGLFALCGNNPKKMLNLLHEGVETMGENHDVNKRFKKVKERFIGSLTLEDYEKLLKWAGVLE
ncbi:hypothetical protein GH808_09150 [Acetobacterium fimetarium]|uniref:Uncharacterized protein n=1 Tax=Acetobacterium fimetarium TaxID=52691 RepID=A0ABR6WVT3_9FIRM|nr:hypothetical protein [Acetobacterium fimetarium]MBC3804596.1 hypothetical protein [Acetobacterium fimetarium]